MRWLISTGKLICDQCDGRLGGDRIRSGRNNFCSAECAEKFDEDSGEEPKREETPLKRKGK